jgi:hypothetical protein
MLLAIAAAILLATYGPVIVQQHAVDRHGADAVAIRDCLQQNGAYQTWFDKQAGTFYFLCQLADGRWGFQAAVEDIVNGVKALVEKTAFVKGSGTWMELIEYLSKFATRYTGPLP